MAEAIAGELLLLRPSVPTSRIREPGSLITKVENPDSAGDREALSKTPVPKGIGATQRMHNLK